MWRSASLRSIATGSTIPFRLSPSFVARFRSEPAPFGFNGLGEFVYQTRYARSLHDGSKEDWFQTVERVVNGTYNMQKTWIVSQDLGWDAEKAQRSAREMYERMFRMQFLPPGRGLWAMGTSLTEERHVFASELPLPLPPLLSVYVCCVLEHNSANRCRRSK
jgi:ribonucleoside-triphosphate reductase (thioredoxin)